MPGGVPDIVAGEFASGHEDVGARMVQGIWREDICVGFGTNKIICQRSTCLQMYTLHVHACRRHVNHLENVPSFARVGGGEGGGV